MLRAITRPEVVPFVMFGFAIVLALLAVEQAFHTIVPRDVMVVSGGTTFLRGTMLDWEVTGLLAIFIAGLGVLAQVGRRNRPATWCFLYCGVFVSLWMLALLARYASDTSISHSMLFNRYERRRWGDVTFYNGSYGVGIPRPPTNEDPYWWHDSNVLIRARVDPIWDATLFACAAFACYHVIACTTLLRNAKRSIAGRCEMCGYSRLGLQPASPCPECGVRPTLGETPRSSELARHDCDGC